MFEAFTRGAILTALVIAGTVGGAVPSGAAPKPKPKPAEPIGPAARGPTNPADVVGRYAVYRAGKETGCMLTLGPSTALLAPACRDNGIVVFDPKAWSLSQRRLVLRARKGHSTVFEMDETGMWSKDAKDGAKPLGLRKM